MVSELSVQEQDYVVLKKGDDFVVSQVLDGMLTEVERLSHRVAAETRAKVLARQEQADAWTEDAPEVYRLL